MPAPVGDDVVDLLEGHSEFFAKTLAAEDALAVAAPYFRYLRLRELGTRIGGALEAAIPKTALRRRVPNVLGLWTCEEVRGVAAGRVVAPVADDPALGDGGECVQLKGQAVSAVHPAADVEPTVAGVLSDTRPGPALGWPRGAIHFRPKTLGCPKQHQTPLGIGGWRRIGHLRARRRL